MNRQEFRNYLRELKSLAERNAQLAGNICTLVSKDFRDDDDSQERLNGMINEFIMGLSMLQERTGGGGDDGDGTDVPLEIANLPIKEDLVKHADEGKSGEEYIKGKMEKLEKMNEIVYGKQKMFAAFYEQLKELREPLGL